jgi:hypothetical protein
MVCEIDKSRKGLTQLKRIFIEDHPNKFTTREVEENKIAFLI